MTFTPRKKDSAAANMLAPLRRVQRKVQRGVRALSFRMSGRTPTAVFVVGSGRSGTDLLVHCLGQSLDVAVFNEDNPDAFDTWKLRELDVVQSVVRGAGAPRALFKPIVETDRTRELLDAFTDSRAVFIVRHYHETISSRIKFFGDSQHESVRRWIEGDFARFPQLPASVADVARRAWAESPSITTAAGINWLVINSVYQYLGLANDPRVALIAYEELMSVPEVALARICRFIDLEYVPRMIREINPGVARPREPLELPAELEAACATMWDALRAAHLAAPEQIT